MTDAAEGQSCVHCGVRDGTVVAAHYQGMRQSQYGKGKGIKPHDLMIADLCGKCHYRFDNDKIVADSIKGYARQVDHSEEFLHCVALTWIRRVNQGVLKLPGWRVVPEYNLIKEHTEETPHD